MPVLILSALTASACVLGTPEAPPTIGPETLEPAKAGAYYEVVFNAGGGGGFSADGAPTGLELMNVHGGGVLFGVAPSAGTYAFDVTVSFGGPTMFTKPASPITRNYTLTVEPSAGDSGLLLVVDHDLVFTATQPMSFDLKEDVGGGQAPYRFGLYCVARPGVCTDADPVYEQPRGVTLSDDGMLTGTIGAYTSVPAQSRPRSYLLFLCVTDAVGAHACDSVTLTENWHPGMPTPQPPAT